MNITPELLEKYYAGRCTETEKKAIEAWLESPEADTAFPPEERLTKIEQKMWSIINPGKQTKTIPLYKTITRYAAAACLAGALFAGGYFTASSNALQEHTAINETAGQGKLQITFEGGRSTQIPGNQFELLFDGKIQLSNLSDETKTIVCGNQTLLLEAGESYFLDRYQGRVSMAKAAERENMHPDFSRLLKGDFTIKVLA